MDKHTVSIWKSLTHDCNTRIIICIRFECLDNRTNRTTRIIRKMRNQPNDVIRFPPEAARAAKYGATATKSIQLRNC